MANIDDSLIFCPEFLSVDPREIASSIEERGYFSFERAVRGAFLEDMVSQIASHSPSANHNDVAPVWLNEQFFFPHALACSKRYFQYVTSSFLRSVSKAKFGETFRLKCHRYYETGYGHSMEWHADNVTNEGVVTDVDGLIFILYVNDVADGEFQLVSDSFKDRKGGSWTYNYTNKFIEETFGPKIKSFKMPAGSIIIYDTFGIHRAKPIVTKSFTRKSIFFQVDSSPDNAEKILLNPAFFESTDPDLLGFLGFGKKHDFPANPPTSLKHAPIRPLIGFQIALINAFIARVRYGFFKSVLTHDGRMRFTQARNNFLKRLKTKHPSIFNFLRKTVGKIG